MNARQKASIAEETLNNRWTLDVSHTLDVSQPLSTATLVLAQWVHEQRDQGGRHRVYAWSQQRVLPLTRTDRTLLLSA